VEHPDLDGAEIRVRTDVPPHFLDRGDGTCPQKGFEVFLESGPVWKVRRWAGGRQGTEDDRPCRGQPGVVSSPKGTGSTQGEKMREVFRQCVDHRNGLVPMAHTHVYVDTAGEDPAGRPLHLFDEFSVALTGAQLLVPPIVHRVCT